MSAWVDAARVTGVPTGVDLEQYSPGKNSGDHGAPLVMFVGAMDWEPNIDAVEYFWQRHLAQGSVQDSGCEVSHCRPQP